MSAVKRVLRSELIGNDPVDLVSSDPEAIRIDSQAWKDLSNSSRVPVKTV